MSLRLTLLFSFGQRQTVMLMRIGALLVLARLLTPAEIGVSVSAIAIIAVGLVLAEFGARSYLIQAPEMTRERRRIALGASLLMSVLTFLVIAGLCLAAPPKVLAPEVRNAVLALLRVDSILTLKTPTSPFRLSRGSPSFLGPR